MSNSGVARGLATPLSMLGTQRGAGERERERMKVLARVASRRLCREGRGGGRGIGYHACSLKEFMTL